MKRLVSLSLAMSALACPVSDGAFAAEEELAPLPVGSYSGFKVQKQAR